MDRGEQAFYFIWNFWLELGKDLSFLHSYKMSAENRSSP
ncbi:TPD52 isoform 11 [Pongo abelii]|uniref:TPD52 isoform 10 n=1 Tax=Pongo abelii TaxID=9601 RepID=A0A2J8V9W5_PONAB|nr:TPD52 isoform 10 [Pongo abelii]PNJ54311.1 TPD52 isoform 11 [Pongo abelii]